MAHLDTFFPDTASYAAPWPTAPKTITDTAHHWGHGALKGRRGWDEEALFLPHQSPAPHQRDSTSPVLGGYEPEWKGQRWCSLPASTTHRTNSEQPLQC